MAKCGARTKEVPHEISWVTTGAFKKLLAVEVTSLHYGAVRHGERAGPREAAAVLALEVEEVPTVASLGWNQQNF